MGWNTVQPAGESVLFGRLAEERFYFVHSYAAKDPVAGFGVTWAEHGERFVAAVESPVLSATQFHPEKSGAAGGRLLGNWLAGLGAS
jgi:glutamine amidotransferase